jgi:hypothetical protein
MLDEAEIRWIRERNCIRPYGYNIKSGGQGGGRGAFTIEHKQKIREAIKRYWASSPDAATRKQTLTERNQTDEARRLASEAQLRRWAKR